jgi:membrane protease subunit HflK
MAWNESGNGRNPWDRGGGDRKSPPDLDRIVKEWQQRLGSIFRGGSGGGGASAPGGSTGFAGLAGLILLGWLATGLYRVDDAERAVVLRFGKYQSTAMPGLRWHIPWPVERRELVNTSEISPFNQQTRMLTADENIVEVDLVVQYRRADPVKYLFNVRDPQGTLSDISESAIREVIGKSTMDYALGEGRSEIAMRTETLIQQTLDEYGAGIMVTKVNLQDVNFPEQVEAAVQDAIKAREDRERLAFEAQAYANDILPRARGESARRLADAEGYKARLTADAQGEAARFEQVLAEYQAAPEVTRERLYIEAIEDVLARTNKILLDAGGIGNMMYVPLDKILEGRAGATVPAAAGALRGAVTAAPDAAAESVATPRAREDTRNRGVR